MRSGLHSAIEFVPEEKIRSASNERKDRGVSKSSKCCVSLHGLVSIARDEYPCSPSQGQELFRPQTPRNLVTELSKEHDEGECQLRSKRYIGDRNVRH
jgi:hypothetical protein